MRFLSFLFFLLVTSSIVIPSFLKELNTLQAHASISLGDFLEMNENENAEQREEESSEAEETEQDFWPNAYEQDPSALFRSNPVLSPPKIYISSYIFSIFIPPLI